MGWLDRFKKPAPEPEDDARVSGLVRALSSTDWKERVRACDELGKLRAAAAPAVPALEEALSDDRGEVCEAAARAVNEIRSATS